MLILSRDHMQIRAAEQEYRGLVARQPYYRKWRIAGSDHIRILKYCHVILNKQTPLTKYIAVSFVCDW